MILQKYAYFISQNEIQIEVIIKWFDSKFSFSPYSNNEQ